MVRIPENDYDFDEVMKYAPFKKEDIVDVIACVAGEADGPDWHYICKLKNGDYGYVHAGCDYTGWGCQESGDGKIFKTQKEMFEKIEESDYNKRMLRTTLKAQLKGKAPYGVITYAN